MKRSFYFMLFPRIFGGNMKWQLTFLLITLTSLNGIAQTYFYRYDSIVVRTTSDTLDYAWAGGLNSPQFSKTDLNFDGAKDLFVFERNGNTVKTFLSVKQGGQRKWKYTPVYEGKFPPLKEFALLRDYNCDGKEDIFTYSVGGMSIYRNDSDSLQGLEFTQVTDLLYSDYGSGEVNLYVASTDIPAITDVDNDGDLDVLAFGVFGSTVEYHQNQSMELYGHCDSLTFEMVDGCWGKFSENSTNNNVTFPYNCKGSTGKDNQEKSGAAHSGSTLLAIDMDGDIDKDLILGDVSFNNMVMLTNGGDVNGAAVTAQDTAFPSSTTPVDLNVFPAGYYLDVDHDSIKDLLVAPNTRVGAENHESVWFYQNTNTTQDPEFSFQQKNFLQDEMIDLGEGAFPAFIDVNADGLTDMLVGNYGYFNPSGVYTSGLAYFKNTGTLTTPEFEWVTSDYENFSALGITGMHPTFGDVDDDGDQDMLIGDSEGKLHLFLNTAGSGNPVAFGLKAANYMSIDVGKFAAPQLVDVNNDSIIDLVVGERSGTLNYFQNYGTKDSAFFTDTATNDFFGEIDVRKACCTGYSDPFLYFDSDVNDFKLYVGAENGFLYVYDEMLNDLSASFRLVDSVNTRSYRISVAGNDLDYDGLPDLMIGEYYGGLSFYKGLTAISRYSTYNSNYEVDSIGAKCRLGGVVHGVNRRASEGGLAFTIMDLYDGIEVYHPDTNLGYHVQEGDQVMVFGTIGQQNGVTQVVPDSIRLLSSGNSLRVPETIAQPSEEHESVYVQFKSAVLVDSSAWNTGVGEGFMVRYTNGSDTMEAYIDNDMAFYDQPPVMGPVHILGTVSQSDSTLPLNDNYFLHPVAFDQVSGLENKQKLNERHFPVTVYPNPASEKITFEVTGGQLISVSLFNMLGEKVYEKETLSAASFQLHTHFLQNGIYIARVQLMDSSGKKDHIQQVKLAVRHH